MGKMQRVSMDAILSLGGNQEDAELLDGIESDDEVVFDAAPASAKVANFMEQLGLKVTTKKSILKEARSITNSTRDSAKILKSTTTTHLKEPLQTLKSKKSNLAKEVVVTPPKISPLSNLATRSPSMKKEKQLSTLAMTTSHHLAPPSQPTLKPTLKPAPSGIVKPLIKERSESFSSLVGSKGAKNTSRAADKTPLLFEIGTVWHSELQEDHFHTAVDHWRHSLAKSHRHVSAPSTAPSDVLLSERKSALDRVAKTILQQEADAYHEHRVRTKESDYTWFLTILKSGTQSDKISALSLAIQESPLHTVTHFEHLVQLSKKNGRREVVSVLDALKDLFMGPSSMGGLLPATRKLNLFPEQANLHALVSLEHFPVISNAADGADQALLDSLMQEAGLKRVLALWQYESLVKLRYCELILLIDQYTHDPLNAIQMKMVSHAFDMLSAKKEQERMLLTLLVNKIGSTNKQVASKASFSILRLLEENPMMKMVVVKEVEQVSLRRAGLSFKAKYSALSTLNQLVFSSAPQDHRCAFYLMNLYFSVFEDLVRLSDDSTTTSTKPSTKPSKTPPQLPLTRGQMLRLRQKPKHVKVVDPSEKALQNKMMAALLTGINRCFPFARQHQISVEGDSLDSMVEAHLTKLFYFSHDSSVSIISSLQALHFIHQLVFSHSNSASSATVSANPQENDHDARLQQLSTALTSRFFRALYALLNDFRLLQSPRSHALFLNLLFKSLKNDLNLDRVYAFFKRIVQASLCVSFGDGFLPGCLVVVSQVYQSLGSLKKEKFFKLCMEQATPKVDGLCYDPTHRSPEYSNAIMTSFWEISMLASHYHPTVELFSKTLLFLGTDGNVNHARKNLITYPSDPLQDFTHIRFLDKFVYKNPKKLSTNSESESLENRLGRKRGGAEMMQPRSFSNSILRQMAPMDRTRDEAMNSATKKNAKEATVPVDEKFYHHFFSLVDATTTSVVKTTGTSLDDHSDNDLEEEEILKVLMKSSKLDERPEEDDEDDFAGEGVDESGDELNQELNQELNDESIDSDAEALDDDEDNEEEEEENASDMDDDALFQLSDDEALPEKRRKSKPDTLSTRHPIDLNKIWHSSGLPTADASAKSKKSNSKSVFASIDDYQHLFDEAVTTPTTTPRPSQRHNKGRSVDDVNAGFSKPKSTKRRKIGR